MIKSYNNFILESSSPIINSIIDVLKVSDVPLSGSQILSMMDNSGFRSKNKLNSLNSTLVRYSDNTSDKNPANKKYFRIIGNNPNKFWLIDRISELPDSNIEEPDVEETQEEPSTTESYSENPFKQSICVLGESGAGKSHTIETILENEGHEFEFIIPTAATTGLLAQFSPTKSGYVPSRLGRMIIEAANNPETLYTAVFDEMHKSNVIEMINDELLQCISIHRNNGVRFISLDDDTAELYNTPELEKRRGNIILPDNFGFIFISSKPRVIANNPDFFNRVDIVRLKHFEEESVESSDDLLSLVLDKDEKNNLISTRND